MKVHDELSQGFLDAGGGSILAIAISVAGEHAHGVGRLPVRHCVVCVCLLVLWGGVVDVGNGVGGATRQNALLKTTRTTQSPLRSSVTPAHCTMSDTISHIPVERQT